MCVFVFAHYMILHCITTPQAHYITLICVACYATLRHAALHNRTTYCLVFYLPCARVWHATSFRADSHHDTLPYNMWHCASWHRTARPLTSRDTAWHSVTSERIGLHGIAIYADPSGHNLSHRMVLYHNTTRCATYLLHHINSKYVVPHDVAICLRTTHRIMLRQNLTL